MKSYMNCHTSKDSEYVDYRLQPVVIRNNQKSHRTLKIQRTFLGRSLIDFVPDNSYLVSVDVKSLHANIANAEGINYVNTSLERFCKQSASRKAIPKFLVFSIANNTQI